MTQAIEQASQDIEQATQDIGPSPKRQKTVLDDDEPGDDGPSDSNPDPDSYYDFGADKDFRVIVRIDTIRGEAVNKRATEWARYYSLPDKVSLLIAYVGEVGAKECAAAWAHKMQWHYDHFQLCSTTGHYRPAGAAQLYIEPNRFALFTRWSHPMQRGLGNAVTIIRRMLPQ